MALVFLLRRTCLRGALNSMDRIEIYSNQTNLVYDKIIEDGQVFNKEEYVRRKYQESAGVFISAYSWFVKEARNIVAPPEGAEYAYWGFTDLINVDVSGGGHVMKLSVPKDEVIFFDMFEWTQILQMHYLAKDDEEEKAWQNEIARQGASEFQIMTTSFYPLLKQKMHESWKKLFRHQEALLDGDYSCVKAVQCGLWTIKKEWLVD